MRVFAMVAAMMTAGICAAGSVTMITDLEADTAKSVTGAQSNVLALAAAHTNRTDNPHGVTAAQIGALTSETDDAALAAVASYAATNQVTRLHDTQSARYFQSVENGTGTVWQITGPFYSNLIVVLSSDFRDVQPDETPSWSTNNFPFSDGNFVGTIEPGGYQIAGPLSYWQSANSVLPATLVGLDEFAAGTATITGVTYYQTNVYSMFASYDTVTGLVADVSNQVVAVNENLNACYIAISNQVETVRDDVDALPAALQPYSLVRYGDFATTNTAGFAGYQATNGATSSLTTVDPVINQKLAAFRYDITNTIYGSVSFSSWVQAAAGSSNNVTFTRLLAYTAGNALLASNDGARVESLPASYSNVTAAVALPYTVTNGYIIAEVYSATNTARDCMIHAGGSYPATLTLSARPLNYATTAEVATQSAVDAKADKATTITINGVAGNLSSNNVWAVSSGATTAEPLAYTPISNVTAATTTTLAVLPQQRVYHVTATDPITLFTNDLSALSLTGTSNAEWEVWLNVADWDATNCTWADNIEWETEPSEMMVTGCYKFAFSSIGSTVKARQTFPSIYPWTMPSYLSGWDDIFSVYAISTGLTNTMYLRSLYQNRKIVVKVKWQNRLNFTTTGDILVGATWYSAEANQIFYSTNPISVTTAGYYDLRTTILPLDDATVYGGAMTHTGFIAIRHAIAASDGTVDLWFGDIKHRPANELEIKAYNAGWRP